MDRMEQSLSDLRWLDLSIPAASVKQTAVSGVTYAADKPDVASGNKCTICMEQLLTNVVELACAHRFHKHCLQQSTFENSELNACFICRRKHLLDPDLLKARFANFRSGYTNWRMGAAKGAGATCLFVSFHAGVDCCARRCHR